MQDVRPRDHAIKILRLPTLDERRTYLHTQVPAEYRRLVETHVKLMWRYRGRLA